MKPIYLHAHHQFMTQSNVSDNELKATLKEQYAFTSRRASRLCILALLGALKIRPPSQTGLYISSSFSSPENIHILMSALSNKKALRPFDFINSINNAVSFYVANALNIEGPNIFIASTQDETSWTKTLLLAITDLQLGVCNHALIGWCHEYKKETEISTLEGSHWLELSLSPTNAIATIRLQNNSPASIFTSESELNVYAATKTKPPINDLITQYYYRSINQLIDKMSKLINYKVVLSSSIPKKSLIIESIPKKLEDTPRQPDGHIQ